MKVYVGDSGDNGALEHHILRDGDVVTKDYMAAEFYVPENSFVPVEWTGSLFDNCRPLDTTFYVTRVFDGQEYLQQWILGVPFRSVMNANLGAIQDVGSVLCHIEPSEELIEKMKTSEVLKWLRDRKYRGIVTWCFDSRREVCGLMTGMPSYGVYGLLEMTKQSVMNFFLSPLRLNPCWSVSMLLSRFPFPLEGTVLSTFGPLSTDAEKHVWLFEKMDNERRLNTRSSRLAVVTAWSVESLPNLQRRVLRTLDELRVPEKQYRTDIVRHTWRILEPLVSTGFISLQVNLWPEKGITSVVDSLYDSRLV